MTCKNKDKCKKVCKSETCKDNIKIDQQQIKDLITSGLNIPKTLDSSISASLANQMSEMEKEVLRQIDVVKDSVTKICKQKLMKHKCQGVVPGTFIVCGEDDYQYCSEACLNIARAAKSLLTRFVEEQTKDDVE